MPKLAVEISFTCKNELKWEFHSQLESFRPNDAPDGRNVNSPQILAKLGPRNVLLSVMRTFQATTLSYGTR